MTVLGFSHLLKNFPWYEFMNYLHELLLHENQGLDQVKN